VRPHAEYEDVKNLVASGLSDGAIARLTSVPRRTVSDWRRLERRSADILHIFCNACDAFGVRWTQPSAIHISVARAPDVAKLDEIVGLKSSAGNLDF